MRSLNRSHAPESNIRGSAFSRAKSTPVEKGDRWTNDQNLKVGTENCVLWLCSWRIGMKSE
jgi:hypothetical protein